MAPTVTPAAGPDTQQRPGWWPLTVIASAHLMAVLDTTIMFVALPSIQHALKMSDSSRQWVVTAYTLALAGLLLLGGRLADKFGARRTLIVGVVGFAVASGVGGASVDGAMLIAARAVQGAFGAVLTSSTRSLLVTTYRGDQRAKAISLFTATLTAGLGVGLVLGGVITSALGWRWCLYLNLVFSAFVVLAAPRFLPPAPRRADVHIDLLSVVLASVGMVGLVYGLGEAASAGWGSGRVVGSLAAAVVLLGGFILRQVGHSDRLLPLRVISDRNRGWGMATLIVNGLSTFAMLLILTYQLQSVMHYSALKTGLALVPFAAGAALGSALIAPRLISRVATRWLLTPAILIEAAGLVPLIWLTPRSGYLPLILVAIVVEGIGTGLAGPVTLNLALRGVLPADSGAAGAATSAAGQLGSSVGAALFNTIAATVVAGYLKAHPGVGIVAGTVHGFDVAMVWGAIVMVAAAIPVALFVNASAPAPKGRPTEMVAQSAKSSLRENIARYATKPYGEAMTYAPATPGPAPVRRRDQQKEQTRLDLALAAFELARAEGLAKVRVPQIAAAVGVSTRTFNNYFPSKEAAIVWPTTLRGDRMANDLAGRPAGEPLADALVEVVAGLYGPRGQEGLPEDWLDGFRAMVATEPALHGEYLKAQSAGERALARMIAQRIGAADSDLEPLLLAGVVIAAERAALLHWVRLDEPSTPLADVVRTAVAMAVRGMAGPDVPLSGPMS